MTHNPRVALNILAPYARSVVALACGLFTARWVLGGLGCVAYGLLGVVVGMAGFVTVIDSLLVSALTRYYAVTLGEGGSTVERVREWFTAGTVVVFAVGTVLTLIGYPIGAYAIEHWLVVPTERIGACLWVWRWSCFGCWVGMVVSPWNAMYTAKQCLVSLSVYAFVVLLVNTGIAAWVAFHPGDWLVPYVAAITVVGVMQNGYILIRGRMRFAECRFSLAPGLAGRVAELVRYASLNSVQALGWLLSNNGMAVLVNKLCGPMLNSSLSVSNAVKIHSSQLSTAVQGAFSPVISTAYGANDLESVRKLALRVSKLAAVSVAIFVLPLAVELEGVLKLWLGNPPDGAWELCLMAFVLLLTDAFGVGYRTAIYSSGRIGRFAAYGESVLLLTLPLAGLLWWMGFGVWSIGIAYLAVTVVNVGARLLFARRIFGISIRSWIFGLVLPAVIVFAIGVVVGLLVRGLLSPSVGRLFVTAASVEVVLLPLVWLVIFNHDERTWIKEFVWKR